MSALSACPLCREVLPDDPAPASCPGCGAALAPYRELLARAQMYIQLCRELLSRGDSAQALNIIGQLQAIADVDERQVAELQCRAALLEGKLESAGLWLDRCAPAVRESLRQDLRARQHQQNTARELYNYALTAARRGEHRLAAEELQRATALDPQEPALWRLKLKADLKCGYFQRCYADLQHLDDAGARPAEYRLLERYLPPVM